MSIKYIPNRNTKIIVDKIVYQNENGKNAVLPDDKIGKDELERLLKRKLIVKLEFDESGKPSGDKDAIKAEKKHESLVAKAKEFGITVTDEMTDEEIQQLIIEIKAKQ